MGQYEWIVKFILEHEYGQYEVTLRESAMYSPTWCWRRNFKPINRRSRSISHMIASAGVCFLLNSRAVSTRPVKSNPPW